MLETTWEIWNPLTGLELKGKVNESAIEKIVAWCRELWCSEKMIEEFKSDLLFSLEGERRKLYADKILEEMAEYVIIEDAEVEWYEWWKIKITLPEIKWSKWKKWFRWKTCECFISNKCISADEFKNNLELVKKSWSIKNVWYLLWNLIRKYMEARGLEWIDSYIDKYENALACWSLGCESRSEAWRYLKKVIEKKGKKLDMKYWLKDTDEVYGWWGLPLRWRCDHSYCYFTWIGSEYHKGYLFLRLSD